MQFLQEWLPNGHFSTDIEAHLNLSDNEVASAIWKAAGDETKPGHVPASQIVSREHFRQVYEPNSSDEKTVLEPAKYVYDAAVARFGATRVYRDLYAQKGGSYDFPIYTKDEKIDSSLALSRTLSQVPTFSVDRVYVSVDVREEAERWLIEDRENIIGGHTKQENSDEPPSKR
jgi:hypothetical protein